MLSDLIRQPADLEALAGSKVFARGLDYFQQGAVTRIRAQADRIEATVAGSDNYQVELWVQDDHLHSDCTCPHAAEGYFCKHLVALGLAYLNNGGTAEAELWSSIENYVTLQSHATLVDWVLQTAQQDDAFYRRLARQAGRLNDATMDVLKHLRRSIDQATQVRGFIEYHEISSFIEPLDEWAEEFESELGPDTAAQLLDVLEYAMERIEAIQDKLEDVDGEIYSVSERLGELHVETCAQARPDPKALALRLFNLATTRSDGTYRFDPETYKESLGVDGLAHYQRLADSAWQALTPKQRQNRDDSAYLLRLLEKLARARGNVDALIEIKSRDLSRSYDYFELATICRENARSDEAMQWAEAGIAAFNQLHDSRLADFLAEEYAQRGRYAEAIQLVWHQFEFTISLARYQVLNSVASTCNLWPVWREAALDKVIKHSQNSSVPNYSLRVEIALWEQQWDEAWRYIQRGECDIRLLEALAVQIEADRPNDAAALYRRSVPVMIDRGNNHAYNEAIQRIHKIAQLMQAQDEHVAFINYLADLRLRFKPKRNFIKLLDDLARRFGVTS